MFSVSFPASPYHSQAPVNGFEQSSADAMANSVDQSKAPGYRGNMKSPANDNAIGGGVSVPGPLRRECQCSFVFKHAVPNSSCL